jgi:nicotinate phosphoribosyltransferase
VAKRSKDKPSVGGRKYAVRALSAEGIAEAEMIGIERLADHDHDDRQLLVPLVRDGKIIGDEPLEAARERHRRTRAELPMEALKMSRGEPVIETIFSGPYRPPAASTP